MPILGKIFIKTDKNNMSFVLKIRGNFIKNPVLINRIFYKTFSKM